MLTEGERHTERVMLRLRLASGLPVDLLAADGRRAAERAVADGLLEWSDATPLAGEVPGRVVLTRRGRLLADAVVRDLLVPAPAAP